MLYIALVLGYLCFQLTRWLTRTRLQPDNGIDREQESLERLEMPRLVRFRCDAATTSEAFGEGEKPVRGVDAVRENEEAQ